MIGPFSLQLSSLQPFSPQQTEWLAVTLLHSLWQAMVVAVLLVSILRLIPAARSNLRYLICSMALLSVSVCSLATWSWVNIRHVDPVAPAVGVVQSVEASGFTQRPAFTWEEAFVAIWLCGLLVMTLRIVLAYARLRTLRRRSTDPDDSIRTTVERLLRQNPLLRRVEILMTDELSTAAVAGLLRPVLFIPAAMASGLSVRQLEVVIAHELAHIRRFDVIANFLQMVIEAALFFNPAVWWMSRQVRFEREACCDAVGVATAGDPVFYSETLAVWAEQLRQRTGRQSLPVGAMGFAAERRSTLLQRVRRVLFPNEVPSSHFSPWSTLCLLLIGLVLFGSLWKGTQVAVAFVDELLPHNVVVEQLKEKREEFGGDRLPISVEVTNDGAMEVDLRISTTDGQPTTSDIDVSYATFRQLEHSTNSNLGSLAMIEAGESQKTVPLKFSWAHLMFSSDDYVPVVVRNVKPDKSGRAVVDVKLDAGYNGRVRITDQNGQPVAGVTFELSHLLKYSRVSQASRSMRSSGSGSTGSVVGKFVSDADGFVTVPHVNNEPNFAAKLHREGFETKSVGDLSWEKGVVQDIVLQQALPLKGSVVDVDGRSMAGVKIYEVASRSRDDKDLNRSTGNDWFCKKGFRNPIAVTDANGEFSIRSLDQRWKYVLLADAGDRGYQAIPYTSPGSPAVTVRINGPLTIRGTVSGVTDRLKKKGGEYELRYGVRLDVDPPVGGDMSGRIPLEFVDGKATFELSNVVPGKYDFFLKDYEQLKRGVDVSDANVDLQIEVPAETKKTEQKTTERTVRLNFQPQKGVSEFRGRISIHSRSKDRSTYHSRPMEVAADVVEFTVNAPTKVTIEMMDAPGFLFENGSDLKFEVTDDSSDLLVQNAVIYPGGAIYGQLVRAEQTGEPIGWFGVQGETAWKTEKSYRSTTVSQQCDDDGRFFIDHLTYDSKTKLIARSGSWCKPLDPIRVDALTPKAEVRAEIGVGPDLRGKICDVDGNPVSDMDLQLLLFTDRYQKYSIGHGRTDGDGEFSFGMINPDAGEHFLKIVPTRDFAPAFVSVDASSPTTITLAPGGVVEGRLVDDTGQPVAGAEVYAMLSEFRLRAAYGAEAEGKTDEDGRFRFSNLGDETYELNTRVLRRQVEKTLVTPGDTSVLLKLKPER